MPSGTLSALSHGGRMKFELGAWGAALGRAFAVCTLALVVCGVGLSRCSSNTGCDGGDCGGTGGGSGGATASGGGSAGGTTGTGGGEVFDAGPCEPPPADPTDPTCFHSRTALFPTSVAAGGTCAQGTTVTCYNTQGTPYCCPTGYQCAAAGTPGGCIPPNTTRCPTNVGDFACPVGETCSTQGCCRSASCHVCPAPMFTPWSPHQERVLPPLAQLCEQNLRGFEAPDGTLFAVIAENVPADDGGTMTQLVANVLPPGATAWARRASFGLPGPAVLPPYLPTFARATFTGTNRYWVARFAGALRAYDSVLDRWSSATATEFVETGWDGTRFVVMNFDSTTTFDPATGEVKTVGRPADVPPFSSFPGSVGYALSVGHGIALFFFEPVISTAEVRVYRLDTATMTWSQGATLFDQTQPSPIRQSDRYGAMVRSANKGPNVWLYDYVDDAWVVTAPIPAGLLNQTPYPWETNGRVFAGNLVYDPVSRRWAPRGTGPDAGFPYPLSAYSSDGVVCTGGTFDGGSCSIWRYPHALAPYCTP